MATVRYVKIVEKVKDATTVDTTKVSWAATAKVNDLMIGAGDDNDEPLGLVFRQIRDLIYDKFDENI